MNILITGATGLIGTALLKKFSDETPYSLCVLTRNKLITKQNQTHKNITYLNWEDSLPNADIVVHLAGENVGGKLWTEKQKTKIYESRVNLTHKLIQKLQKANCTPKLFISASAVGYYGDRGNELLLETDSVGSGFLSQVCKDWEDSVNSYKKMISSDDLRIIILRFGLVLSNKGGVLEKLANLVKFHQGSVLGSGDQWQSWIHIEDLISIIKFMTETPKAHGVFNAVSPMPLRQKEFMAELNQHFHKSPFPKKVPTLLLKLVLGEMSSLLLDSQRVSCEKIQNYGFNFKFKSLNSALKDLYPN